MLMITKILWLLLAVGAESLSHMIETDEIERSLVSDAVCCKEPNLISCNSLKDEESLKDKLQRKSLTKLTVEGKDIPFSNEIPPNGFVYKNKEGDEAILSINQDNTGVFGSLKFIDGRSLAIEHCGDGHVLKEYDVSRFKEDTLIADTDYVVDDDEASNDFFVDNTTLVTYSVMFYYTPEFASVTTDIVGYIDQVLDETNQGYEQSGVPVRVTRFCVEAATINDIEDTSDFLSAFRNMKADVTALKNTADAAALLALDFNSCGVAYLNTVTGSGRTISIATKSCALGYFSFGHELGHNFGAHHDPDQATNSYYDYGHGHLIAQGSATTGRRTILAYNAAGHSSRVNYYSNPAVTFPGTGTPTGVAGLSNNAAVISRNRFVMAGLGDESATCSDGFSAYNVPTPAPTSPPPTTASPTPVVENCLQNKVPVLKPYKRFKAKNKMLCRDGCNDDRPKCDYSKWKDNKNARKRVCYLMSVQDVSKSGWWSGEPYCPF